MAWIRRVVLDDKGFVFCVLCFMCLCFDADWFYFFSRHIYPFLNSFRVAQLMLNDNCIGITGAGCLRSLQSLVFDSLLPSIPLI